MASHTKEKDREEPQEDDELTEQYDMDSKMNSTTNGLAPNARSRMKASDLRNRIKQAKSSLLSDRHYQINAILLLIIVFLGIMLIYVSCKLLIISFAEEPNICQTSPCLQTSARVKSNLNSSLNACDDFFNFACDGWMTDNALTDNQGYYSVNQQVSDQIYDDMRRFLDQILPTTYSTDPHYKVKRFYDSCMALGDIDLLSFNYFKHDIQKVGGWNIIEGSWNGLDWNQATTVERLQVLYGVNAFFRIDIGTDDLDPTLPYIIKIYPSGLGLPKSYYFEPKFKNVVEAYKQYMSETVKIFHGTKLDSSQFAENTFNYEKRIAEITPDKIEYLTSTNVFKRRFSIRELKVIAPSIKWTEVLQKYFAKARLNDNTRVLLAFESYFRNVSNIISTTDNRGLNDYLIWRMITAYAPYLSKDFRIIHRNFHQALYGMPQSNMLNDENRWKFCIESASKHMGYALSSLYFHNKVGEISKITVSAKTEIISLIRDTIVKNSNLFKWNTNEETNKLITTKLKQMDIFVGQPNFVVKGNLVDYYNEFMIQTKFLENVLESIDHTHKKMEMLLNEKKADYSWPVLPHEVHLTYDYAGNKLYVPFGALTTPLYNAHDPIVLQFGSIGFHVASQMLRAFDLTGQLYATPDGRLASNRSLSDRYAFNSALECLRDDLSELPFKSNETLSQTYIDIGALKIAWLAFKEFVAKNVNDDAQLPTLPYTTEQLFFLSFGQSMCSNIRSPKAEFFSATTNTLPDSERVNFVLKQSKIFNEAFKCSAQIHSQRCELWN